MHKYELVSALSSKTGVPRGTVEKVIDAFTETATEVLRAGEQIHICRFGTFLPESRSPRIGRNPHTREPVQIPARILPKFKPAEEFKNAISATKSSCTSPAK